MFKFTLSWTILYTTLNKGNPNVASNSILNSSIKQLSVLTV